MNPRAREIQDWINGLLDEVEFLLAQGEDIPDDILGEIADQVEDAYREIDEIEAGVGEEPPPQEPIPDNAQLLWRLSGGQPNAFVSYLREFPDPALQDLLQNPGLLANMIQRLQIVSPIDTSGSEDGIPHADLNSSNVYGFSFDPKSKRMKVRFQSGSVYQYDGIPDEIFNLFSHGNANAQTTGRNRFGRWWRGKNPSLGAALNQYIKQAGYPYRRLR